MFTGAQPKYSMNATHDFVVAPYNDIPATNASVSELPPDSLAAILVEPMQVAGGCVPGRPDFLQYLRELATKQNALLIFDEVMTSRLDYGGIQTKLGIRPDITTIGKWAGGGMSFGAFGGRREIMEMFDPRTNRLTHSGTFNNNVVTMAAGIAGCLTMDKKTVENLNALGNKLQHKIAETIKTQLPIREGIAPKMFVTGLGSLFAVRFDGPEEATLQALLYHHFLENGIYIATRGFFALSIEIKEEHLGPLITAMEGFIDKYRAVLI
jgi:glutamate-1-semialdehyde 2,1-aminomutase